MPTLGELLELSVDNLGVCEIDSPLNKEPSLYREDDMKVMVYSHSQYFEQCIKENRPLPMFEAAGPRKKIFFDPKKLNCGIVTCGGLCPGLNDVIRTVALTLLWQYGVQTVYGFRYGYQGLSMNAVQPPMILTPEILDGIQHDGGTILGSSRGQQDPSEMINTLLKYQIGVLFVIGGDGTFSGGHHLVQEIQRREVPISVIGIPKTIDNDIYGSEKTFGFSTAVGEARRSIYIAHEEAKAAWNGIGLVKLMGRDSGFIAAYASLANSDVNFCFIPEVPICLDGENGFLKELQERILSRRHAVIVVAEGVGRHIIDDPSMIQKDASGNVRYKDIGMFLKDRIKCCFDQIDENVTIKYIDPSYTIRSCPANAEDSAFCLMLGQNAVHAAMAGKTNMFVGYWNHHFTHVPLPLAVHKRKVVDPQGELWQTLVETIKIRRSLSAER
ncbi:MAG: ATP-dependent 6-phosphofructokinase [Candidatus Omnitrophica bacterium]|nr:ATP-dependent 6-phosphofructokinase [Candidatus Omnitrophota bacterium]